MSHLLLSHLSKNNNNPHLVKQLFDEHADGVKIVIASRYKETEVYHICDSKNTVVPVRQHRIASSQLAFMFAEN